MLPVEITKDIYWVGVRNPDLRVFDVIMRTDWGTSYNSYLIKGAEKIALVDTAKLSFADEHFDRISGACDISSIDYIICNHTEPDHSGALDKLLDLAPNAVVVCSKPASVFLRNILNRKFECMVVEDENTLELGGKTLKFISAPFLHWPDSMFTYVVEDAVLLSGDVFGFHFSAENVFDDLTPLSDEMLASQKYYFDVIMGPFKNYVLDAVKKVRALHIDVIGPSHGPDTSETRRGMRSTDTKTWASDILSCQRPEKRCISDTYRVTAIHKDAGGEHLQCRQRTPVMMPRSKIYRPLMRLSAPRRFTQPTLLRLGRRH